MSFLKKKGFAVCMFAGAGLSAALCTVLLLLWALLIYKQVIAQDLGSAAAILSAGICVFAASALVTRSHGRQALALGASVAAVIWLTAVIARVAAGEGAFMTPWIFWFSAAVLGGGLLGSLLGAGKNTRRKRIHKRRR